MANSASPMYTVSERSMLQKPIKAYKVSIDTTDTDLVIHTPDADKSVYHKGSLFSEQSSVNLTWKQRSPVLAGTVATTSASATITGTDTTFLEDYAPGDQIVIDGGNTLIIQAVTDDTEMTATTTASSTVTEKAHQRQQTLVTPELGAYQGGWSKVQKDAWDFATRMGHALVLSASAAVSSMLIHVQEAKSDS